MVTLNHRYRQRQRALREHYESKSDRYKDKGERVTFVLACGVNKVSLENSEKHAKLKERESSRKE